MFQLINVRSIYLFLYYCMQYETNSHTFSYLQYFLDYCFVSFPLCMYFITFISLYKSSKISCQHSWGDFVCNSNLFDNKERLHNKSSHTKKCIIDDEYLMILKTAD